MTTSLRSRASRTALRASANDGLRLADFIIDGTTMATPPDSPPPRPPVPHAGASYDLSAAVPVNPHEDYQEGDEFLFPDLTKGCRIVDVYADGAYGCDVFQLPHREIAIDYRELTTEEMYDLSLLLVAGVSLPMSGRAN